MTSDPKQPGMEPLGGHGHIEVGMTTDGNTVLRDVHTNQRVALTAGEADDLARWLARARGTAAAPAGALEIAVLVKRTTLVVLGEHSASMVDTAIPINETGVDPACPTATNSGAFGCIAGFGVKSAVWHVRARPAHGVRADKCAAPPEVRFVQPAGAGGPSLPGRLRPRRKAIPRSQWL